MPVIRPAKFGDIPRLLDLVQEMHARSVYAGRATIDPAAVKSTLFQAIKGHGRGTCAFVAESDVGAEGFIVGLVDRIHGISVERYATDWLFYVSPAAGAHAAIGLFDAFRAWADAAPGVIEIRLGTSAAVLGEDWRRVGALYRRRGFVEDGAIYVRRKP